MLDHPELFEACFGKHFYRVLNLSNIIKIYL